MRPAWLSRNVLALGLVSLLTDIASEMALPFLPLFLTTTLGASALALGTIEGAADSLAALLKLVSGRLTDRFGRARRWVLSGYLLSSLARPLLGVTLSPWHVLGVRLADRTGKGLRTSPRDVLLAAAAPAESRARAFSFHRAMDHTGAVIGPLVALAIVTWVSADLRVLFWLTAIPGALAVLAIVFGVRELAQAKRDHASSTVTLWPSAALVRFLVPFAFFTLGNARDAFLWLKVGASRAPLMTLPLLWMALHVTKVASSLAGGYLADRFGRRRTIAAGWALYAAIYFGFAHTHDPVLVAVLFVVYGLYHGLAEGPTKALIAELAPRGRGTAFGWYNAVEGALALPASRLFGFLWYRFGDAVAFTAGAGLAAMALVTLGLLATRAPVDAAAR